MHRLAAAVLLALIAFPSLAAITGTVMTSDGAPVAGARVSVQAVETPDARRARWLSASPQIVPLLSTQTDARGNWSLESPKEPVVDLVITAAGFDPLQRRIERDEETGAVVLVKSELKSGTVRAGGKAVAGATVIVGYGGGEYIAKTDGEGRYQAPDPKRARNITVIHPDWAIEDEPFMGAAPANALNRTLSAGTTITGRVLGADGNPAAKVPVMVDGWPVAVSGDDGTFTIAHAPSKWTAVTAQSGPLSAMRAQSNEKSLTLKLAKSGTFTGRVTDAKTKLPVQGAAVSVGQRMGRGPLTPASATFTDAKGNFSMNVAPGGYMVIANHPAYEIRPVDLSISAGQTQSRDIAAAPLARVSGVVMNEDRKPVAAATIAAEEVAESFPPSPMRMMRDSLVVSGPDGRFSTRIGGDVDMRIRAARRGLPPAKSEPFRVAPGDRKSGVVITIPNGIAVTGKVTDRDGKPLSGVSVVANEAASGPRGMMIRNIVMLGGQQAEEDAVKTGTDGLFTLQVKEGTYDFVFKREGFSQKALRGQTISVTSNPPLETSLDPAVEITGRVVRNGVGVEGVMINTFGEGGAGGTATTTADGSFTISGLSPGEIRAFLRKESDFIQETRTFTAPGRDVLIELPTGSRISGRVVDKATRKPVASFQAGVSTSRGGGGMVMMAPPQLRAFTNDDGSFVLENIPTGAVNLVASAPGYAQARMNLTLEEGKPLSDIELELDPGTKLTGKVTGPDGSALSGATVRVAPQSASGMINLGNMGKQTVTDSNGEYTLDALEPTDENIEVSHQKYIAARKQITVKGREVRLDVQLSAGQRVTGVVVTESGAPVPDAEIEAMAGAGVFRNARSDANGNFVFESLSPARYRFSAGKRGFSEARVDDVDISSGAPVRLVMKSGSTIYGQVRGLTPEELQSATVEFRGESFSNATVDSTGNYRLEGAPVGTVRVAAVVSRNFSTRKSSQPQTVTVGAGESRQVDLEFRSDTVITGRVTRNGKPLASANISFQPRRGSATQTASSATTDQQGNYTVSGLEAGEYNVSVMDMQRFSPYQTTYDVSGSSTFDIDYTANALRGRVVDAATGDPLSDARVRLRAATASDGPFRGDLGAATDVAGSFSIDFIAPGTYTVTADKQGFGNEVREVVISDRAPPDLELKLSKNDGVTLKVVDARNGQSINAFVWVFDTTGRVVQDSGMRFGESASDIKLNLAPGAYVATVSSIDYAPVSVNFTSPGTQSVSLSPGGKIVLRSSRSDRQRVRLVDSRGLPYPRTPNPTTARELAASPATLPLDHIAPGSYTIQVLTNNDTTVVKSIPVVVTERGVVEVDV